MKQSFNATYFNHDFRNCIFTLYITENVKYITTDVCDEVRVQYDNVESYDLIAGGEEAAEIEAHTDASGVDEYHEYLVLHFTDGTEGTFRNSHVDMFVSLS